uniref:MARVEL domain-containing protein n=1 Tax=Steinernema glaseri TaxID=37863 RepID=A0A1I7Y8W3_9BILA
MMSVYYGLLLAVSHLVQFRYCYKLQNIFYFGFKPPESIYLKGSSVKGNQSSSTTVFCTERVRHYSASCLELALIAVKPSPCVTIPTGELWQTVYTKTPICDSSRLRHSAASESDKPFHSRPSVFVRYPTAGEMSSPQVYSGASLGIRLFIVLLVIVSMILIMTAPGVCFWRTINGQQTSQEICPPSNSLFPMNIDRWNSAIHFQMRGQNVWGQLAVIIIAIIFAIPSLIFSCLQFANGNTMAVPQMLVSGVSVIVYLVLGAVETWYATGFDHMQTFIRNIGGGTFSGCAGFPGCETGFIVKGWAAAAAFLFLCAVLHCIDIVLVFLRKDK